MAETVEMTEPFVAFEVAKTLPAGPQHLTDKSGPKNFDLMTLYKIHYGKILKAAISTLMLCVCASFWRSHAQSERQFTEY